MLSKNAILSKFLTLNLQFFKEKNLGTLKRIKKKTKQIVMVTTFFLFILKLKYQSNFACLNKHLHHINKSQHFVNYSKQSLTKFQLSK